VSGARDAGAVGVVGRTGGVAGAVALGVRTAASRALDLALPPRCAGCRREGSPLCRECHQWLLARVAAPPGAPIGLPAEIPPPLVQLEWCAPFTGTVRRAVHDLKYAGERRLTRPLGEVLAERWRRAGAGGDVLVPVPASPNRIRERGYDQAVLLAEVAGHRLGLPVVRALERIHVTEAQHALGRVSRAVNVGHVFALRGGQEVAIRDRWAVLVDDVVTTGATVAACAAELMDAGAAAVSAVTVARER
jgi:ComF family protein